MSDAVMIALIGSISTTLGIITVAYLNTRQNKNIKGISEKVDKTSEKVDGYHKEVNGKMEKLLETTEELGKEKGKAEEKSDQDERDLKT